MLKRTLMSSWLMESRSIMVFDYYILKNTQISKNMSKVGTDSHKGPQRVGDVALRSTMLDVSSRDMGPRG